MDIKSQVIEILASELGVAKENVLPNSKIMEDLGADSLDTVELVQTLEEKFNIKISNEDTANIKDVQGIIDYVTSKVGKK